MIDAALRGMIDESLPVSLKPRRSRAHATRLLRALWAREPPGRTARERLEPRGSEAHLSLAEAGCAL
jgi:hypothetical protein